MKDEFATRSQFYSSQPSRLSSSSTRHFDFLDTHHSVFSRSSYYSDKLSIHPWLRRPCSRHSGIALSTLTAGPCSPRTEELSRPRIKRERLIRQEFFDNIRNYSYSGVKATALTANCSDRLSLLAKPKKTPVAYLNQFKDPAAVAETALQAHITNRIEELAKPRQKKLTYQQSLLKNKQTS